MRHMLGGAGIIDQCVQTTPGCGCRDDSLAILVARHVTLNHDDFAAGRAAEIGGVFGLLLAGGIVDNDARAVLRQYGGGRPPPTGRPAPFNGALNNPRHPQFPLLFFAKPAPPRPDPEPFITAQKTSPDIPISPSDFWLTRRRRFTISCSEMPANRPKSVARN